MRRCSNPNPNPPVPWPRSRTPAALLQTVIWEASASRGPPGSQPELIHETSLTNHVTGLQMGAHFHVRLSGSSGRALTDPYYPICSLERMLNGPEALASRSVIRPSQPSLTS